MKTHTIKAALLSLCALPAALCAQIFSGKVVDDKGNPVPQASIYIAELQQGAAASVDGAFSIRLPKGEYNCTIQCVGYTTINTKIVVPHSGLVQNIVMPVKAYEIAAVVVTKSKEDPAYRIMRQVIGMAPYYSNQVSEYKANVYIKGSAKIEKISRILKALGGKEFREGIKSIGNNAVLLESINEIYFRAPNTFRHKVISTNSSIPLDNFKGLNTMDFVSINLYQLNFVKSDAFRNYKFTYEGITEDNGHTINKIRVTPRIKNPMLVSGFIYILEGSWHIYSVDLSGDAKFGTYKISGNCYQIRPDVYLPAAMHLEGTIDMLGNKINMSYQLAIKYTDVLVNKSMSNPTKKTAVNTNDTKIDTKRIKIGSKRIESDAKRIKIDTNRIKVGSKSMEFHAKSMQIDSFSMKVGSQSMEVHAKSMEFGSQSMKIDSFSMKNDTNRIYFLQDSMVFDTTIVQSNDFDVDTNAFNDIFLANSFIGNTKSVDDDAKKINPKKFRRDSIKRTKRQQKINALLEKEDMSDRDMARLAKLIQEENDSHRGENYLDLTADYKVEVDSGSRSMSAAAWDSVRPVVLSDDEAKSYMRRDSLMKIIAQRDSIDKNDADTAANRVIRKIGRVIGRFFVGTTKFDNGRGRIMTTILDPESITFNAVDGFRYGIKAALRHQSDSGNRIRADVGAVWAFARSVPMWSGSAEYHYLPKRRAKVAFSIQMMTRDFNYHQSPTHTEIIHATLLTHRNYSRLYERFFVSMRHEIDIVNGLVFTAAVNFADKRMVENHSNFAYFFPKMKYEPNNAVLNSLLADDYALYRSFAAEIALYYTPEYFYRFQGRRKVMVRSAYPTFSVLYRKSIPKVFGSKADFDFISVGIRQKIAAGFFRQFSYNAELAAFLTNRVVDYADFLHFRSIGFPIVYNSAVDPAVFRYKYATNVCGAAVDAAYVSPLIFLKYIPKFSQTYCRENIKWHVSYSSHGIFYNEIHYTISEILLFIELGCYVGFENDRFSVFGLAVNVNL
jgi:hypothetical protein